MKKERVKGKMGVKKSKINMFSTNFNIVIHKMGINKMEKSAVLLDLRTFIYYNLRRCLKKINMLI
ncbi:hypothetical protein NE683_15410 [Bariatricus massiliensis]|nr:hypothetical protein [Bariatricus massiliensis]